MSKLIPLYSLDVKIALAKLDELSELEKMNIEIELKERIPEESSFYKTALSLLIEENLLIMKIKEEKARIESIAIPVDYVVEKE